MSFQDLQREAIEAVDEVMAEDLRLFPMKAGRADPGRQQITIQAPLRVGGGKETNAAGTQTGGWSARIVAGRAQAHISLSRHPDLVVRGGDQLRAVERPGEPWFEVTDVDDRTYGRLILNLNESS